MMPIPKRRAKRKKKRRKFFVPDIAFGDDTSSPSYLIITGVKKGDIVHM